MKRLNPEKLRVSFLSGATPREFLLPRRYTLTHSDITGKLFLSIGSQYNTRQISDWYVKLMRDEVLAEFCGDGGNFILQVYCHVSGGLVIGTARLRYKIFQSELPLALEAIRYGDMALFESNPELDQAPVYINFHSTDSRYEREEDWGTMGRYR